MNTHTHTHAHTHMHTHTLIHDEWRISFASAAVTYLHQAVVPTEANPLPHYTLSHNTLIHLH